jgi:hypothetical protein
LNNGGGACPTELEIDDFVGAILKQHATGMEVRVIALQVCDFANETFLTSRWPKLSCEAWLTISTYDDNYTAAVVKNCLSHANTGLFTLTTVAPYSRIGMKADRNEHSGDKARTQ